MTLIRPLTAADHHAWVPLWAGYLRFYRATLPESVTQATWARLLDPAGPLRGLGADSGGRLIGLCHSVIHATTWDTRPVWYLQDLFVDPAARGSGAAKALIQGAEAAARAEGCALVYWLTQEYNGAARSLYDTLASRTSFVVYEQGL